MSEFFVFYDTSYYPYVVNEYEYDHPDSRGYYVPIEADSAEEAAWKADPSPGDHVFVVPWESVQQFTGPLS